MERLQQAVSDKASYADLQAVISSMPPQIYLEATEKAQIADVMSSQGTAALEPEVTTLYGQSKERKFKLMPACSRRLAH